MLLFLFISLANAITISEFDSLNGPILIDSLRYIHSNYTASPTSYTGISLIPDPTCFFVSTSYFESPACPHSHCGPSFPVAFSTGLFKKSAICIPTRHDYHFTFQLYEPLVPRIAHINVRLFYYLTEQYITLSTYVFTTLDPDILVYCNSARMCLITTKFCRDLSFTGANPPMSLFFNPASIGDTFKFSVPSTKCEVRKLVPLDDVFFNLPYVFEFSDSLKFYTKNPRRPVIHKATIPSNFSHAYTCSNFSLCPTTVPMTIDIVEHSVHVAHTSLGASIVRSFFHALSSFFSVIFDYTFSFITAFISDSGVINFLDAVFVFGFLKFFICTSNALVVSGIFLSLKVLTSDTF